MGIEDIKAGNTDLSNLWSNFSRGAYPENRIDYVGSMVGCTPECPCKKYGDLLYHPSEDKIREALSFKCPGYTYTARPDTIGRDQNITLECHVLNILDDVHLVYKEGSNIPLKKD
jgi:hypothetical protein